MHENEKDFLPLFVHLYDPIGVIVIANQLVGMDDWGVAYMDPDRAYNILHQLYNHPETKSAFPPLVAPHFENKLGARKEELQTMSLVGYAEFYFNIRLFLDVEIREDSPLPVLLRNFATRRADSDRHTLDDLEVTLSTADAFTLFANICSITPCENFNSYRVGDPTFNVPLLKQKIVAFCQGQSKYARRSELRYQIESFVLDYLQFLRKQLQQEQVTPCELLRLSGAEPVAFLADLPVVQQFLLRVKEQLKNHYQQLSLNQKIMYYTLWIVASGSESARAQVNPFYRANKKLFDQIEEELFMSFILTPPKTNR